MSIHIGQKIKEVTEKRGISKAELGRRLNMSSTNVHKIFLRETIDTGLLTNISVLLEHNFFSYYLEILPSVLKDNEIEGLKDKINYLEKIIASMGKSTL